jgi:hypothetical protein
LTCGARANDETMAQVQRLVWITAVLTALGCGDRQKGPVATLIASDGPVERAIGTGGFAPVNIGAKFSSGDAARTGPAGGARLNLARGGGLQMEPSTLIRFGAGAGKADFGIDVEMGASEVEVGADGAFIELDMGLAQIAGGGSFRLSADGAQHRLEILVGTATVTNAEGTQTLTAGEGLMIDIGTATVIERTDTRPDAAPPTSGAVPPGDAGPSGDSSSLAASPIQGTVVGRGASIRAPGDKDWQRLASGQHDLPTGAELRLRGGTSVDIDRRGEKSKVIGPALVTVGESEGPLLEAKSGRATITAIDLDVRIDVPGGYIVARKAPGAGSRADIDVGKNIRVRPRTGSVDVVRESDGVSQRIQLGESAIMSRSGQIEVTGRAPKWADLTIFAGTSPVLHTPHLPVAVKIDFKDKCADQEGVVELAANRTFRGPVSLSKGRGAANILVPAGLRRYRIRCIVDGEVQEAAAAQGSVHVVRDAGTKPLPAQAPHNIIDTDGRRYTVLYQNLLPTLTFRWRKPKGKAPFKLNILRGDKLVMVKTTDVPELELPSGALGEGTYTYFFQATGATSQQSTLRIDFDNAAPSAYLSSPKPTAAFAGQTVTVAGAAMEGWDVSIAGDQVALDAKHRFSTVLTVPKDQHSISVKFRHPKRGTHFYLRRDSQAPRNVD